MKLRATLLALITAGIGGYLLLTYLKRFEAEASGGPRICVLATIRTLEPGAILRDEDIGERWIPQSYVETRAIRVSDRQRIANLRVTAPLQAQQQLMWTDIVLANDDKRDVVALVQPGMRVVTIRTEGKTSTLVRPGDRVDVIGIFTPPNTTSDARTGVVLLQNVLVLGRNSEGNGNGNGNGNENGGSELALSLSLHSSQVLAVAAEKGKLSVAVRGRDEVHIQDLGDFPSKSLMEMEKAPASVRAAPQGPVPVGAR